ncbi:MAG: thymidine phosphorylase [Thermoanaerobaculia bacterium]|nr:thymidine phosphorylase [Thermoanaerobaculia bacterium]
MLPYRIIARKREGQSLRPEEIEAFVGGTTDGSWSDAQLASFLMAAAIRGLDGEETRILTEAMLESGERWDLAAERPLVCDKHSTGGVGDKVSLVFAPWIACLGSPVAMLTGRGLGHTGGTADKLEAIPGLSLDLDRERCLELLDSEGIAIGVATEEIAPADRELYALRHETATIESLPLITGSILSKKLATGAGALVLDVKTGPGAFLTELEEARRLARLMVDTADGLGFPTAARVTDMSQPLGEWVGHSAEVLEALRALEGEGPEDLVAVTEALIREILRLQGREIEDEELAGPLLSGQARERFLAWAGEQGAEEEWLRNPELELAPEEVVLEAEHSGFLASVDCRQIGLLLVEAGGGRSKEGDSIDVGVSMQYRTRLGEELEPGEELARLYLRRRDENLIEGFRSCFELSPEPVDPPDLLYDPVRPESEIDDDA